LRVSAWNAFSVTVRESKNKQVCDSPVKNPSFPPNRNWVARYQPHHNKLIPTFLSGIVRITNIVIRRSTQYCLHNDPVGCDISGRGMDKGTQRRDKVN
jgi:hypothetical protein